MLFFYNISMIKINRVKFMYKNILFAFIFLLTAGAFLNAGQGDFAITKNYGMKKVFSEADLNHTTKEMPKGAYIYNAVYDSHRQGKEIEEFFTFYLKDAKSSGLSFNRAWFEENSPRPVTLELGRNGPKPYLIFKVKVSKKELESFYKQNQPLILTFSGAKGNLNLIMDTDYIKYILDETKNNKKHSYASVQFPYAKSAKETKDHKAELASTKEAPCVFKAQINYKSVDDDVNKFKISEVEAKEIPVNKKACAYSKFEISEFREGAALLKIYLGPDAGAKSINVILEHDGIFFIENTSSFLEIK